MAGEDAAAYDEFMELVIAEVDPEDLADFLLTKDVTDAEWELVRLHAIKSGMVNALIPGSLHLTGYYGGLQFPEKSIPIVRALLRAIVNGDPAAEQKLAALLAEYKLTVDELAASAFRRNIGSQVHADRMIAAAMKRRHTAWAEIERRRAKRFTDNRSDVVPAVDGQDLPTAPREPASEPPVGQHGSHPLDRA
jgi:hypothetical protein